MFLYVSVFGIALYKIWKKVKDQGYIKSMTGIDLNTKINLKWMTLHLILLILSTISIVLQAINVDTDSSNVLTATLVAISINRVGLVFINVIIFNLNQQRPEKIKKRIVELMAADSYHTYRYMKQGHVRLATEKRNVDAAKFLLECDNISEGSLYYEPLSYR